MDFRRYSFIKREKTGRRELSRRWFFNKVRENEISTSLLVAANLNISHFSSPSQNPHFAIPRRCNKSPPPFFCLEAKKKSRLTLRGAPGYFKACYFLCLAQQYALNLNTSYSRKAGEHWNVIGLSTITEVSLMLFGEILQTPAWIPIEYSVVYIPTPRCV
jgi:hypothetical protein